MSNALRIMIVEDDSLTAWTIEENLVEAGYTICGKATDFESAIRIMKNESPDLALIDVSLKGLPDGISTAQELTRIKWIPLIYLTGNTEMETYKRAKKTHPAAFLHKPFKLRELAIQIDLAIHNFYEGNIPSETHLSDHLYVPADRSHIRIKNSEILYAKANRVYTELFLTAEEFERLKPGTTYHPIVISINLGNLIPYLSSGNFYKLSRSILINLDYLDRIEQSRIFLKSHEISLPDGSHKTLIHHLKVVRSRKK